MVIDVPTIKDVARLAGVAPSTVSIVLSNKGKVSERTREKILQAVNALGYIPNGLARNLARRKTFVVGLLMAEVANPYHATLLHHLEKELRKRGYRLSVGVSEGKPELEMEIVKDFISQKVDGVFIHTADVFDVYFPTIFELKRRSVPVCLIGGELEGISLPVVDIALEAGSYELTNYLVNRGYRRFLYLSGPKNVMTFKRRIDSHKNALMRHGCIFDEKDIVETTPNIAGGYEVIRRVFSYSGPSYDVVLCANDFMAFGVLKAFDEIGIKVPAEIGVAGFDDIEFSSVARVPLTTVRIPIHDLAKNSVDVLYAIMEGREGELTQRKMVVPLEVIPRSSTK